jgi:hypothetical protein
MSDPNIYKQVVKDLIKDTILLARTREDGNREYYLSPEEFGLQAVQTWIARYKSQNPKIFSATFQECINEWVVKNLEEQIFSAQAEIVRTCKSTEKAIILFDELNQKPRSKKEKKRKMDAELEGPVEKLEKLKKQKMELKTKFRKQ